MHALWIYVEGCREPAADTAAKQVEIRLETPQRAAHGYYWRAAEYKQRPVRSKLPPLVMCATCERAAAEPSLTFIVFTLGDITQKWSITTTRCDS